MLKKNLPELIFAGFCLRMIVMGASMADAVALISMVAIYGLTQYLSKRESNQFIELNDKIIVSHESVVKEIENLKNGIAGLKLNSGLTTRKITNEQISETVAGIVPPKRYF